MNPPTAPATFVLGLDVGGTKTSVLAADTADRVLGRLVVPTEPDALSEGIVGAARRALDGLPDGSGVLTAVGIGAPGQVDPVAGTVRLAVNLDGRETALGSVLRSELGVPCFLEHDARAAAAWLHAMSDGVGGDLAYLSVGTGVSAGLVLGGRVHRGANGLAGEIGHVVADPDGPVCPCGLRGCLEAVASGPALSHQAEEAGLAPDPAGVYAAASAGNPVARAIVERAGAHLARAILGLALTYGVTRIVIGGGVSGAGDAFLDPILAALEREQAASRLARAALRPDAIRLLSPDSDAGAWGAVMVARAGLRREEVGHA